MSKYKELNVYKKAYNMTISIYKFTKTLPKVEQYGLASQMTRAAMSVTLNIAEGYSKEDTMQETKRFLRMSKGSCGELSVLISICKDLGYMEAGAFEIYEQRIDEISRMLYGLIKKTTEN